MPAEDARRWNARYKERIEDEKGYSPQPFLIAHAKFLPTTGLALDIAMGLGGNAGFLASRGLRVIGVDISVVGVRAAKARYSTLMGVVADLTRFCMPENSFDVILNFNYLQRDLWPGIEDALRPGGVLFFETMTERMLLANPSIDPNHVLAVGELATAFPSLETILYEEDDRYIPSTDASSTARLIARKPLSPGSSSLTSKPGASPKHRL